MADSKKDKSLGYSNNFFEANDVIKIVPGLWRPGSDKPLWLRLLYFFYVSFIYFNGFAFILCEYLIFNDILKDIPKLLSYIGMCLTHTLGVFKMGIFVFGQEKIDKIMTNLQHDDFKYVSLDENGPSAMFLEEKRISNRIAYWVIIHVNSYGIPCLFIHLQVTLK